ncbi:MAG: hypothetical protein FWF88_01635 [Peptococcaceae bacterium]|nr:hypothetical protein [Peptococcaceae bacterium]
MQQIGSRRRGGGGPGKPPAGAILRGGAFLRPLRRKRKIRQPCAFFLLQGLRNAAATFEKAPAGGLPGPPPPLRLEQVLS